MRRHPTAPVNVARIGVVTSGTDFTAPRQIRSVHPGCCWMTIRLLATAHTVQKEIHRLADTSFDLFRGGTNAKRCKPQIAVNNKADELLGGTLKIINAQLRRLAPQRRGDGPNGRLPSLGVGEPPERRPTLRFTQDDAVKTHNLRCQSAAEQVAPDLHQHRLQFVRSQLELVDRNEPAIDEIAKYGAKQLFLVTIAGIDRALRHARRLGDRINRGAVETQLHEHRAGSFNEMLPPPFWT